MSKRRAARMSLSPERRREIAAMGGRARTNNMTPEAMRNMMSSMGMASAAKRSPQDRIAMARKAGLAHTVTPEQRKINGSVGGKRAQANRRMVIQGDS